MSATEDVVGVVETAANEFKKMMDTLVSILEKMKAAEEAAKAAQLQESLIKAIQELKDEVANLKEKPEGLTPEKVAEVAAEAEGLNAEVEQVLAMEEAPDGLEVEGDADVDLDLDVKGEGLKAEGEGLPVGEGVPGLKAEGGGEWMPGKVGEGAPKMGAGGPLGMAGKGAGGPVAGLSGGLDVGVGGVGEIGKLATEAIKGPAKELTGHGAGFVLGEKGKWMRPEGGPVIGGHRNAPTGPKVG